MDISTWSLPVGDAADKSIRLSLRMKAYRLQQEHCLNDGTVIIPNIKAMFYILKSADEFGLPVAISKDDYHPYRAI